MSNVLIVDDEESICWSLSRVLEDEGHCVSVSASAEEALGRLSGQAPDLIMLDVRLPGMDGLSAMSRIRKLAPAARILVMTAFGDLETAVAAFGNGAVDYLPKPFDVDVALHAVERTLAGNGSGTSVPSDLPAAGDHRLIGACPAIQELFRRIALVAATDSAVLITGESGTGKELAARAIYRHSRRAQAPFVPINLAALSPGLVESELFGHVLGAFTGADRAHTGLIELADGGTVFFDEIGDVPLPLQVKLLRVIEQQELTPVGATQARKVRFRVVAATSRDLQQEIRGGRFREDLYFRLAVFQLHMPPLRERGGDLALLAEAFLRQANYPSGLSASVLAELRGRRWPGNVRELRSALETAMILARGGPIVASHLPTPLLDEESDDRATHAERIGSLVFNWAKDIMNQTPETENLHEQLLAIIEPPLLRAALEKFSGNRVQAAKGLGLHRATLRKKLGQQSSSEEQA